MCLNKINDRIIYNPLKIISYSMYFMFPTNFDISYVYEGFWEVSEPNIKMAALVAKMWAWLFACFEHYTTIILASLDVQLLGDDCSCEPSEIWWKC